VWLQWRVFGPGDHEHRPLLGGPLAHYTQCVPGLGPINMYGKSLVNMFWLKSVSNAHAGFFRRVIRARSTRTTDANPFAHRRGDGMHVTDALEPMPPVFDEASQRLVRASSRMPLWLDREDRSATRGFRSVIHHYMTRSHDDYVTKMQRGTADKKSGASIRTQEVYDKVVR